MLALAVLGALMGKAIAGSPLDTTVSLRADAWSGDRELTDEHGIGAASVWGSARLDGGSAGQLVGNGWVRAESGGAHQGRLRELYWRSSVGPVDVKLGRQVIAWGRADGLNPTDNLTPRDYTLLVADDGDARYGNEAANVAVTTGLGVVSAIWFPRAAHSTIPLLALPGVHYMREARGHRAQWAAKWELAGDGIDGALSYFSGADPMPTLVPGGFSPAGIEVLLHHEQVRVVGADLSLVRNSTVWRAEAAWTRTDSSGPSDLSHKKPQLWLVAGAEWELGAGATLGLQAALQHVDDFASPDQLAPGIARDFAWRQAATSAQTSRNQGGMVWRVAQRALNDNLLAELSGVAMWPSKNGLARARISYSLSDHVQLHTGIDHYYGKEHSFFGQLRANQTAYVQLRYGF
jgi:hypothetical protein